LDKPLLPEKLKLELMDPEKEAVSKGTYKGESRNNQIGSGMNYSNTMEERRARRK
jgi:hypothetical protein